MVGCEHVTACTADTLTNELVSESIVLEQRVLTWFYPRA